MIPIGLNLTSVGVSSAWWIDAARRAEAAGFSAVWCWDHFVSQGRDKTRPVLECWTTLTAAAAATSRVRVGSFVSNVMNRQPAVLARMVATLADQSGGRVDVGLGVGGYGPEDEAYGIEFPPGAERVEILEESVAVMRALWRGGPADFVGRHFRLRDAWAYPVPDPVPRIIVGGETAAGARLAARVGDGWTTNAADYERLLPIHLEELARVGRSRPEIAHLVAVTAELDRPIEELGDVWERQGADELVVSWIKPANLDAWLDAAKHAGLG